MGAARTRNSNTRSIRNAALRREQEVLFVEDVMEILGVGQSKAYQIMQKLNKELAAEGYIIIAGRVPVAKFRERIYSGTLANTSTERSVTSGKRKPHTRA